MRDLFSSPLLRSRVRGEDTQKSEQILGYFLGPCLVYTMYTGVAGTYLTQFYTDILGMTGAVLTLMPFISKIFSSITGFLIGRMIDRTRTAQGKARPWILMSGILLAVCGCLLYTVPRASFRVKLVWVIVSYNLFFSLAFSVYSLSHSLMVPLSTRNTGQRDTLAMLTSTGTAMIPGMLATIIMPLVIRRIGVGAAAQGSWITVMCVLSILAIPATAIEYYFTLERITGESGGSSARTVSFGKQVAACFRDKYWVLVIIFTFVLQICGGLSSSSMLYYCNWVLGSSVSEGATRQILVNMIGQAPMGFGVVALWPLVRKFGKRKVILVGFSIAAVGSLLALMNADNLVMVLVCLFIRSCGAVPTYVMVSLLAEALDHIEWKNGFRTDGFSASAHSILQPVSAGLAQTLLLAGITAFGYIAPESTSQIVAQPEAVKTFFSWCFTGLPVIGYGICAAIMVFYDVEDKMPRITQSLARKQDA